MKTILFFCTLALLGCGDPTPAGDVIIENEQGATDTKTSIFDTLTWTRFNSKVEFALETAPVSHNLAEGKRIEILGTIQHNGDFKPDDSLQTFDLTNGVQFGIASIDSLMSKYPYQSFYLKFQSDLIIDKTSIYLKAIIFVPIDSLEDEQIQALAIELENLDYIQKSRIGKIQEFIIGTEKPDSISHIELWFTPEHCNLDSLKSNSSKLEAMPSNERVVYNDLGEHSRNITIIAKISASQ